jgi:hypothetical protein
MLGAAAAVLAALLIPLGYWIGRQNTVGPEHTVGPDRAPLAAGNLPPSHSRVAPADPLPNWDSETEQRLAEVFWNEPSDAAKSAADAGAETRWGQDVQTSLEPLTRSTAAALDSLWQAIPAAEDSRS